MASPETLPDGDRIGILLLVCVTFTLMIQLLGFAHGFALRTEKLFDFIGALNSIAFVPIAEVLVLNVAALNLSRVGQPVTDGFGLFSDPRKLATAVLFVVSRLWLLGFLAWRAQSRKGDARFEAYIDRFGAFLLAWLFQAVWVLCVAMSLIVVLGNCASYTLDSDSNPQPVPLSPSDYVCFVLFAAGLFTEVAADVQKARWVGSGRPGGFCEVGLWFWSRHPNYFGEILMWFAMWGVVPCSMSGPSASTLWPWALVGLVSPGFTCLVLLLGSGMPTAEGAALSRYYQNVELAPRYTKYRESTSILVPMPPAVWRAVPGVLKRTVFCEWKMYEYSPPTCE